MAKVLWSKYLSTFLICTALQFVPFTQAEQSKFIPLNAWVHDPVISSVAISPDGSRIVALTLTSVDEPVIISLWNTHDLGAKATTLVVKKAKVLSVQWLNNDKLIVLARQKYDYHQQGKYKKWYKDLINIIDTIKLKPGKQEFTVGKHFGEILANHKGLRVSLFHRLPQDKNTILVSLLTQEYATDIYAVNLNTLESKKIYRGARAEGVMADYAGRIRGKVRLRGNGKSTRLVYSYKNPKTGQWKEHHEVYSIRREGLQPVGFDPDGETLYLVDNRGRENSLIRKYNLLTEELSEALFYGEDFAALATLHSKQPEDLGKLIGFIKQDAGIRNHYSDPFWASLQKRIDQALPADQRHKIISQADDLGVMIIHSTGPKQPGEYHLLIDGSQLVLLGKARPSIQAGQLATRKLIRYVARDGLEIPAFLTVPNSGKKPYAAVILPHGGPWARDYQGFDPWAQFLANRGYVVLQPQYRGSKGWGQKLWRAGDREWGQKMQDDKDDGAYWLVQQGLADKERLAMFGYSYGGYAAMVAVVRPDTPYQCAIAGAGLSELATFDKITFTHPIGRQYQNPTIAGLSPLEKAGEAKIPILIFHGDRLEFGLSLA